MNKHYIYMWIHDGIREHRYVWNAIRRSWEDSEETATCYPDTKAANRAYEEIRLSYEAPYGQAVRFAAI